MRIIYTLLVVSLHKINMIVCFAAPLNTQQKVDLRQSVHESFYSVAGRAARANFENKHFSPACEPSISIQPKTLVLADFYIFY